MDAPSTEGAVFCRAYRGGGGTAPIVLVARPNVDREAVARYGAEAYVAKRFDLDELLQAVDRLVGHV